MMVLWLILLAAGALLAGDGYILYHLRMTTTGIPAILWTLMFALIIAASIVVGVYVLLVVLGTGLLWGLFEQPPVNDKIPRAEYVELCEEMDVESFYRIANDYGRYVSLELTVIDKNVEHSIDVYDTGATYYRCRDLNGGELIIYVQDCNLGKPMQFLPGDMIRVYGESAGMMSYLDGSAYTDERPCMYMAYCELIG